MAPHRSLNPRKCILQKTEIFDSVNDHFSPSYKGKEQIGSLIHTKCFAIDEKPVFVPSRLSIKSPKISRFSNIQPKNFKESRF